MHGTEQRKFVQDQTPDSGGQSEFFSELWLLGLDKEDSLLWVPMVSWLLMNVRWTEEYTWTQKVEEANSRKIKKTIR